MKKIIVFSACLIVVSAIYGQNIFRYSNNPIPKLNVIGIAISESVTDGKSTIDNLYKGMMELPMEFTCLLDPTYKKIKDRGGVDFSLFGKSLSGKKFKSTADSLLQLNSNLFTLLLLDRQHRVRAFSQATNFDHNGFCRATEELLLNLDGNELITVNSLESDDLSVWQTDLAKETEEAENKNKLIIDFGAGEKKWFALLGKELPDVKLKSLDDQDASLHTALDNNVTLLYVFVASSEPTAQMFAASIAPTIALVNEYFKTFGTGNVDPGDEFEPRAKSINQ